MTTQTENENLYFDLILPFVEQYQFGEPDSDWPTCHREFRQYLRESGVKLGEFDPALRKSFPCCYAREEFLKYFAGYRLIVKGDAPVYVVDAAYSIVLQNAWHRFADELSSMSNVFYETIDSIMAGLGFLLAESQEPLVPINSIAVSSFMQFLINRAYSIESKAVAVLMAPYACYNDSSRPEEWLSYVFGMNSEGKAILPMLEQVLGRMRKEIEACQHSLNK